MVIGRWNEQQELLTAFASDSSEFVAVTGRRRVGKTFLVQETFEGRFAFIHTGLANRKTRAQLHAFRESLIACGMQKCRLPVDWFDAFALLAELLDRQKEGKKVIFLDELPWMDAPRSNLVAAITLFWERFASLRNDILLIACGSTVSWFVTHAGKASGRLHRQVSCQIHLAPFTLNECAQYARSRRLGMWQDELLECYMVLGGIPGYWSLLEAEKSLAENIDALFFAPTGRLQEEYEALLPSIFRSPAPHIQVVAALGTQRMGMTRDELIREGGLSNSGLLTRVLEELEACGFIRKDACQGIKHITAIYRLIDHYTLFYYKFLHKRTGVDGNFWCSQAGTPLRKAWEKLAFEQVCFGHLRQIKQALDIDGIATRIYSWRANEDPAEGNGTQVDLVIHRADRIVHLCELRFSPTVYVLKASDEASLPYHVEQFRKTQKGGKAIYTTIITPMGVGWNRSPYRAHKVVTAAFLFRQ